MWAIAHAAPVEGSSPDLRSRARRGAPPGAGDIVFEPGPELMRGGLAVEGG